MGFFAFVLGVKSPSWFCSAVRPRTSCFQWFLATCLQDLGERHPYCHLVHDEVEEFSKLSKKPLQTQENKNKAGTLPWTSLKPKKVFPLVQLVLHGVILLYLPPSAAIHILKAVLAFHVKWIRAFTPSTASVPCWLLSSGGLWYSGQSKMHADFSQVPSPKLFTQGAIPVN